MLASGEHLFRRGVMKLLLFDIDGTLLDVSRAECEAFSQAFEEVAGIRGVNRDWGSYLNYTDTGVVAEIYRARLNREPTIGEAQSLLDGFVRILEVKLHELAGCNREIAGARGFLEHLRSTGRYATALATGCIERSARLKLGFFGMNRFFPCGGFSDHGSTRVEILRAALDAAAVEYCRPFRPADAVYLGDRFGDAQAALGMGVGFMAVGQSEREREEMKALGVAHVFRDYTDQEQLLRALEEVFSRG